MKDVLFYDRIKELTHITGTSDIILEGAANGFSAFSDYLSIGDHVFYAITDGVRYEVGSGVFGQAGSDYTLTRNPVRTSLSTNNIISFPNTAVKEVYATYPGAFAIIANPEDPAHLNRSSGIAYWSGNHSLDGDHLFVWDETNNRLGVNIATPASTIDINGDLHLNNGSIHVEGYNHTSEIRVSGIQVGFSGINFVDVDAGYFSGRQKEPFIRNSLCEETSGILELSGDVDQVICFSPQTAGTFLGVPSGQCPQGCGDDHPVFRTLAVADIPNLSGLYVTEDQNSDRELGNVAFYKQDKHITYSDSVKIDTSTSPAELVVSGDIRLAEESNSITGGVAEFNSLETKQSDPLVSQIVSNTGIANDGTTENVIVNERGLLVIPTFNTEANVETNISALNVGAIAFATTTNTLMVANGTDWVKVQLN